jgi:hypothetical protein
MKISLLVLVFFSTIYNAAAQQSDFIVLKKRNDRPLKSYYAGVFISAVTNSGFTINGYITDIRNDSVFVQQEIKKLVPTQFGSKIDTVRYNYGLLYTEIAKFNYEGTQRYGKKKGFVEVALPKIMIIGGVGFIVLELVNTVYRGESLSDNNKLAALGIAAGVAAAGFIWQRLQNKATEVGGKFKVVYVKVNPPASPKD